MGPMKKHLSFAGHPYLSRVPTHPSRTEKGTLTHTLCIHKGAHSLSFHALQTCMFPCFSFSMHKICMHTCTSPNPHSAGAGRVQPGIRPKDVAYGCCCRREGRQASREVMGRVPGGQHQGFGSVRCRKCPARLEVGTLIPCRYPRPRSTRGGHPDSIPI